MLKCWLWNLCFIASNLECGRVCFQDDECPLKGDDDEDIYCCPNNECCHWDPTSAYNIGYMPYSL